MTSKTLAVIPARGGSTRIPRKNVREVGGKPLIAHTIEQAMGVEAIDKSVVSTDDEEIKDVAEQYGGNVPFKRPASLATDTASTAAVVTHALDFYASRGEKFETVCVLQVTAPLRRQEDIIEALEKLESHNCDTLVSVAEYHNPPQWALKRDTEGYLDEKFLPKTLFTDNYIRSQDTDRLVHPNGAIFVADVEYWCEAETFYTDRTLSYEMPAIRSFDIDEPWELDLIRTIVDSAERGTMSLDDT